MAMVTDEELIALAERNSSFSKTSLGVQIGWDSTSLTLLKECPYKYYLTMIRGLRQKSLRTDLYFGLLVHKALELYDHRRAEDMSYEEAVRETIRFCLEKTGDHVDGTVINCNECDYISDHLIDQEAADNIEHCPKCGEELSREKIKKWYPWKSDHTNKTRYTFVRSIVWYLDQFKDDPAKTIILDNGKPAVELSFRMEIPIKTPDNEPYILSGHIDRLVEFSSALYFMDRKTTKNTIDSNFFAKFSPDNQMSLYSLASKVVFNKKAVGGIVDGMQIGVTFTRMLRGFVRRTPGQLDEWLQATMFWIKQAEQFAINREWPQNDTSCNNYGKCPFRDNACSKDPSVREKFLATNFKHEVWDPMKSR